MTNYTRLVTEEGCIVGTKVVGYEPLETGAPMLKLAAELTGIRKNRGLRKQKSPAISPSNTGY